MSELVIIEEASGAELQRNNVVSDTPIPRIKEIVWVSGNGDVAYQVKNVEYDYRASPSEIRVLCEKQSNVDF